MVEPSDISQAVLTRISGDATLSAAIPGDVWYGRAPEGASRPYGTVSVKGERPVYMDGAYTRKFFAAVAVYMLSTEDVPAVQRQLEAVFVNAASSLTLPVAASARILACVPAAPELALDPEMRSGSDVAVPRVGLELNVQGDYPA